MNRDYDHLFKLLLIGESGVGKSCLLLKFTEDIFENPINFAVGMDFRLRTILMDGKRIKLQIWDTAGQERYRSIIPMYYRNAHGIILVYDITDKDSFNNVKQWLDGIEGFVPQGTNMLPVGNKCDMEGQRAVDTSEAKEFADQLKILFFEASAKDSLNVEEFFNMMTRGIKDRIDKADMSVLLGPSQAVPKKKSKRCC